MIVEHADEVAAGAHLVLERAVRRPSKQPGPGGSDRDDVLAPRGQTWLQFRTIG